MKNEPKEECEGMNIDKEIEGLTMYALFFEGAFQKAYPRKVMAECEVMGYSHPEKVEIKKIEIKALVEKSVDEYKAKVHKRFAETLMRNSMGTYEKGINSGILSCIEIFKEELEMNQKEDK